MNANVLIILDKQDAHFVSVPIKNENWNVFKIIIDYRELHKRAVEIARIVKERNIDFVLYSRNDQVANRTPIGPINRYLRVGYSSFSGIDEGSRIEQMRTCYEDFSTGSGRLNFECHKKGHCSSEHTNDRDGWTFSIIFDTEQLGCVRYGLPRILTLLEDYNVKATFFMTNLMRHVYPNVTKTLKFCGHEIGLHGLWHEYLSDLGEELQVKLIEKIICDLDCDVSGANFIGRMNKDTIKALIENKISYFVYPSVNSYYRTSYLKYPTNPSLVCLGKGAVWMLPISVETYGFPWFSIKNTIDSTIVRSNTFHHISILCHPFRDGNLAHIHDLEKLISYLIRKAATPVRLIDAVSNLHDSDYLYHIDENNLNQSLNLKKKLAFPQTKQDFLGVLPENVTAIHRLIRRKII